MAYYHLRVKSDTGSTKAKTSAVAKVDYINRDGKYKDLDAKQMQGHDIFTDSISFADESNLPKIDALLYDSPFGQICLDKDGKLKVSKNASIETTALALQIAQHFSASPIEINGSDDFIAKAICSASELDLDLSFKNQNLETIRQTQKEEFANERHQRARVKPRTNRKARRNRFKSENRRGKIQKILQFGDIAGSRRGVFAGQKHHLRNMSGSSMVLHTEEAEMLLPDDERYIVRNGQQAKSPTMRWTNTSARRRRITDTTANIIKNLEQQIETGFPISHVQYINRESAFQSRGGCVFTDHHLPKWAKDDPKVFFREADKWERKNGERYKEIEMSLPNELNLEQQKEIVDEFIKNNLSDFYYTYAIHDKTGTLSDGERHPHIHIMFNTRKMDDVEKRQERTPKDFFSGAKRCHKDTNWNDKNRRNHLRIIRKDFADIQNKVLKKYGFSCQVDESTLKIQRLKALKSGHHVLADVLNRLPEKYIYEALLLPDSPNVINLKKFRQHKNTYIKDTYARDLIKKRLEEQYIKNDMRYISKQLSDLDDLLELPETKETAEPSPIEKIKQRILKRKEEISLLAQNVIFPDQALNEIWKQYMPREDYQKWQQILSLKNNLITMNQLYTSLQENGTTLKKNIYNELQKTLQASIQSDSQKIKNISKELLPAFSYLIQPSIKKKINAGRESILFESREDRMELQDLIKAQKKDLEALQVEKAENINKSFTKDYTLTDILHELKKSYWTIKRLYERSEQETARLGKAVISYDRAIAMAKNNFTNGKFKDLRAQQKELRKRETYYTQDCEKYQVEQESFNTLSIPTSVDDLKTYNLQKTKLADTLKTLKQRELEILQTRNKLQKTETTLNQLCSTPAAIAKINEIAVGIIQKNKPSVDAYNKSQKRTLELSGKLTEIKKQIHAVQQQRLNKDKSTYRAAPSSNQESAAHTIANAILGDPVAVPGAMRVKEEWALLTEEEKKAILDDIDRW